LGRVEAELVSLEASLPKSPAVFSHNDLLAGNIMRGAETGDITLIDFE
jgi:thiamine kinase-like enzyme